MNMETITNDTWILTVGTFLPLVGVLLRMFVPATEERTHKQIGILTSAATLAVGIWTLIRYDFAQSEKLQFFVDAEWITVIRSN
jgi:NADH-quinone oxidoreductase subunit M